MADDKDLSPEEKAKKDREAALEEQDNPPQPSPTQEELNKIKAGEPLDDDEDDPAAPKRPNPPNPAPQPGPGPAKRAVEAEKPSGGYQTR